MPACRRPAPGPSGTAGADALVTYALLHAGEALDDPELETSSPLMTAALARMKATPADPTKSTYFYSVEAQALGLAGRESDRSDLERAAGWLLRAQVGGAYGYVMPTRENLADPSSFVWDGSNSQYGVLGVWAASEAGVVAPPGYWREVERHWLSVQNKDGSWGYHSGQASAAMTAAGITTLSVAAEQRGGHQRRGRQGPGGAVPTAAVRAPTRRAVRRPAAGRTAAAPRGFRRPRRPTRRR